MIKIVVDSTASFTRDFCLENNLSMVSLNIIINNEIFEEGFSEDSVKIQDKLFIGESIASTSQPNPKKFYDVFNKIIQEGNEVLYLGLSSGLSGTNNSSRIAKSMFEDSDQEKILIFDSRTANVGIVPFLKVAMKAISKGKSLEEIQLILEEERYNTEILFTVDNLDIISKSGRVSKLKGAIAGLLNIRPIFSFDRSDGKVIHIDKAKGKNSVIKNILSKLPNNVEEFYISHGTDSELSKDLIIALKDRCKKIEVYSLSLVLLCNGGPTALAVSYLK